MEPRNSTLHTLTAAKLQGNNESECATGNGKVGNLRNAVDEAHLCPEVGLTRTIA